MSWIHKDLSESVINNTKQKLTITTLNQKYVTIMLTQHLKSIFVLGHGCSHISFPSRGFAR